VPDTLILYEARNRLLHAALLLLESRVAQPAVVDDEGRLAWDELEAEYERVAREALDDACRSYVKALDEWA
jgi:hypothetical protein